MAALLHYRGDLASARALFEDTETRQADQRSDFPFLHSVAGYDYWELLLDLGEERGVLDRATNTLEWATSHGSLLTSALNRLALGCAHSALGDAGRGAEHIDQAVDGLRAVGQLDYLSRGLMARGSARRSIGNLFAARQDLQEARKIIHRSGFRLFEADLSLEEARLLLAEGHREQAQEAFARGKVLVEAMGYGRRRPEVAALARELA